jgi:protocatechuate 3,4-dioxygenase beta subunit
MAVRPDDEVHDHDRGLSYDLSTLLSRRRAMTMLGGVGLAGVAVACTKPPRPGGPGGPPATRPPGATTTTGAVATTTTTTGGTACTVIPEETGGPYPGDGSNGQNVLNQSGIVRSDIRSSFGASSGTPRGVPLTVELQVLSTAAGCAPLAGAAVYAWHCDSKGLYSMYSPGATDQNYLRGVQETDAQGGVTFISIFPAAYMGRWPHVHFEVYPSVAQATASGTKLRTSQLALPEDVCDAVYATADYPGSAANMTQTPLATDNVFSDGWSLQMATMTGSVADGYVASLTVPV